MTRLVSPGGPTLEAVAVAAGVSRSTVSRVINGSLRVSDTARSAVEQAIDDLGYVPNRAARSLVTRRTGSVALVAAESETRVFTEPFFPGIIRGVSAAISGTDLQLVLLLVHAGDQRGRLERYLTNGHADGVLLLSVHGDDPLPRRLAEHGLPVVMAGRPLADGTSYVDADNRGGARDATRHLRSRGREVVATITGPLDMAVGQDRLDGYHDGLDATGGERAPLLEAGGDFSQESGAEAMRELLTRRPDIDAVFAASDLMAVGALQALRLADRRVPEDVAVVGFDDSIVARSSQPPLSTIGQPFEEMGRVMFDQLQTHLTDPDAPPAHRVLPTELIIRATS